MFWLGLVLFALGIFVSVCLHEFGHMLTAKAFGMKVTHYFAGFGPTLWSFHRGETEYGLKAVPAGGFVKIVGMTPLETVPDADQPRAFWRAPLWKRTVVLSAGSITHFLLAIVVTFIAAISTGLPSRAAASFDSDKNAAVIYSLPDCVIPVSDRYECAAGDPPSAARAAGLREGDRVLSVGSTTVRTYADLVTAIRATPPGVTPLRYERDGQEAVAQVDLIAAQRPDLAAARAEEKAAKAQDRRYDSSRIPVATVSAIGVGTPDPIEHYSLAGAFGGSAGFLGGVLKDTGSALKRFPSRIPALIDSIKGDERDPNTPISVVGASRIGGEAVEMHQPIIFLTLFIGLNVFIGIFNLFPLLPLDGGHIAIAWFERVRSGFARRRGRPDPGRVDYEKLMPLTYAVILVFGAVTLLTLTADIVNPIRLS